jgi:pyruvate,water dikinase
MRRDILELGRRLVAREILEQPDDVFFLTGEELRGLVEHLDMSLSGNLPTPAVPVHERKQTWQRQHRLVPPEYVGDSPLVRLLLRLSGHWPGNTGNTTHALTGIAGSPGKARGPVCIVSSPIEFARFRPGQILVAPYTTPAWTPLLALASGVVTERGGALSHAAIVAREYGIPAVLGISGVVGRLRDGDLVEVDGDAGCVFVAADDIRGRGAGSHMNRAPARTDSP